VTSGWTSGTETVIELTYLVLIGAVTVSLTAMTWSGFALRFPIILAVVTGHAVFLYRWSWVSEMSAETWFAVYFLTMMPLVVGLVLCLSHGSRSRAAFLALAYSTYLATFMAICNMLLCREDIALSRNGRLFSIWGVVVAFNFAFVFLVSRRVLLCRRQSSWWLPSLAVGSMFALLVVSGLWPVSLVTASWPEFVVFAFAALATGVAIPALCPPSHDRPRDAEVVEEKEVPDEEEKKEKRGEGEVKRLGEGEQGNLTTCAAEPLTDGEATSSSPSPNLFTTPSPSPNLFTSSAPPSDDATGEDLFNQARMIPHQPIPDFDCDGQYLELLGKSAAAGYAPALAKLGDYAMRRGAWVEAYFWMSLAKRNGMKNLDASLREIRREWSTEGFPNQSENVNDMFSPEAGSIGRALLHLDSGHDAAAAREFLKEHYPEFLEKRLEKREKRLER